MTRAQNFEHFSICVFFYYYIHLWWFTHTHTNSKKAEMNGQKYTTKMVKALCNFPTYSIKWINAPTQIYTWTCTRRARVEKILMARRNKREEALRKIWKVGITCRNSCPLECESMKIIYTKRSVACVCRTNLLYMANIKRDQKIVKNQVHISTIHCTMFMVRTYIYCC